MAKVALLIGVSEYGTGLNPLPDALKAVESVQRVLQPLEMGGFDEVKQLLNPNPPLMREAIESLFSGRTQDDLILLFFSGYVVQDDQGKLYFATSITRKSPRAELIRVSTVPASFVHELMSNSSSMRQVVILDGCFSRLSLPEEITATDDCPVELKTQLGGEGRAILTSFTSTQDSSVLTEFDHSVYTRYLVEGMRTGAADLNRDGSISVEELHQYASNKVQIAAPALKPEFYAVADGNPIRLMRVPIDDSKLKYRQEVESWVSHGVISEAAHCTLEQLAKSLQLTTEDCADIRDEVLRPYQEYQEKLQHYKRELATLISKNSSLDTPEREQLSSVQQSLGLRDEDVAPMKEQMTVQLAHFSQADEDALSDSQGESNSLSSTPSSVLPPDIPIPPVQLDNSTPVFDEDAHEVMPAHSQSESSSIPVTPSLELSQFSSVSAQPPFQSTPSIKAPASSASLFTNSASGSTFPKKIVLPIGIGGALATLALAFGLLARKPTAPPVASRDQQTATNTAKEKADKKASPTPSASPESEACTIFVNGNLRSTPKAGDNVLTSLRALLPVTGTRTDDGWVQVKLPDGRIAWANPGIILSESERQMEACLSKKRRP